MKSIQVENTELKLSAQSTNEPIPSSPTRSALKPKGPSVTDYNNNNIKITNLDMALDYANRGWAVFPVYHPIRGMNNETRCSCYDNECDKIGKHPRTAHGFKDATTDESKIRSWWTKRPDANIGIATGKDSGLIVIDVDPRNGGIETLKKLTKELRVLKNPLKVNTGGGGRHYFFRYPDHDVKAPKKLGDGLDIKADDGYVVAAPSLHASGRQYLWRPRFSPENRPLATLPDAWLQRMEEEVQKKKNTQTPVGANGNGKIIPSGERNTMLASLAGSLRRRGLEYQGLYAALKGINQACCRPPLENKEVQGIAKSISEILFICTKSI